MQDFCPIKRVDHLEFYVGNARQSAAFYAHSFGFLNTSYRGLETGCRDAASYVMQQGDIRFVLTTGLSGDHPVSRFASEHGDGVAVVALEVPDVAQAFEESTRRGAQPAMGPTEVTDESGVLRYAAIHMYGDALLKFIERDDYAGTFAPGFRAVGTAGVPSRRVGSLDLPAHAGVGLLAIDHIVGNVELGAMDKWVHFFADTMGFNQLVHFDDKKITTEYSALMSKVMQDGTGRIKFPINEPATGKRKSQIQEYLEYYRGPGIQHIACATHDIVKTVTMLRAQGVDFLRVPTTYYEDLEARVGKIDEPIDKLAELGILVDSDDEGYLLQIFTQPVQDRPTLFFEVIERHGSRGFGAGNFKSLFEAIEREQARRGNLV
ncbi:MAG: 4-hydroxyphenylpyruvate dioxygenase [Vicinamibacterales bacterium]